MDEWLLSASLWPPKQAEAGMPSSALRAKGNIFLKALRGKRWGFPQLLLGARWIPGLQGEKWDHQTNTNKTPPPSDAEFALISRQAKELATGACC